MEMASTQQAQIGTHEKPVSSVRAVDVPGCNGPIVASGSWDKTVKLWDVRQSAETPATTLTCNERVYSIDSNSRNKDAEKKLLFIATAQQHIHIVDLRKPTEFFETRKSTIDMQTTAIRAMPEGVGYGVATVGGKCGFKYLVECKRNLL
jgi:mRNA export factor